MKIIFLDIDGVLNSTRSDVAFLRNGELRGTNSLSLSNEDGAKHIQWNAKAFKLDPIAVSLLKNMVEDTGAKIVISSTWRIGSRVEHFHKMFKCYDWDTTDIIIDFTPRCGRIRGDEIERWLIDYSNDLADREPITKYIIIDDSGDFHPEQKKNHFIQTNPHIGITHVTYNAVIENLGLKQPHESL